MTKAQVDAIIKAYGPEGDRSLREFHMTANFVISFYRYEILGWGKIPGTEELLMVKDKNNGMEFGIDVEDINTFNREVGDGKYPPYLMG